MSKKQKYTRFILLLFTLFFTSFFLYYLNHNHTEKNCGSAGKIVAILNNENLFWKNIWESLREESAIQNFSLSEYQVSSSESIADYLEIALISKPSALIFNPSTLHDEKSKSLLAAAAQQGICLVALDSPYTEVPTLHLGIDNIADSEKMALYILKYISDEKIIFLKYHNTLSTTLLTRMQTIKDVLIEAGYEDHIIELELPSVEIERLETLIEYFRSISESAFIIGSGPQQTLLAAKALAALNSEKEIRILGFGESEEAIEFLKNGIIEAMLIQDTEQMGRLAIQAVTEHLEKTCSDSVPIYIESSLYTTTTANAVFQ